MCAPLAFGIAGGGLAVAAGGVAAYGQYQAGKAQKANYDYLAEQSEIEAQEGEKAAEQEVGILQGEAAQRTKELKGDVSTVKGTQKVAMAFMGLSGVTAEDILNDTTNKAKLDEANIRYNADIQTWATRKGAKDRSWTLRNQAESYRIAGKQAKTASLINIGSTLLSTAASVASIGSMMPGKGATITGGQGGSVTNTAQFGRVWSPSKL